MTQVFGLLLAGMLAAVYVVPSLVWMYRPLRRLTTASRRTPRALEWVVGLLAVGIVLNHKLQLRLVAQPVQVGQTGLVFVSALSLGIVIALMACGGFPV